MQLRWTLALGGGLLAALAGAALWAAIAASTHYAIGYMSIGIAFMVAYVFRELVGNTGKAAGIASALLALLGCVLGNYVTALVFQAPQEHTTVVDLLLSTPLPLACKIIADNFQPMDALFYVIAVSAGYRYAMRPAKFRPLPTQPGPKV
jgi:hypothetical protein